MRPSRPRTASPVDDGWCLEDEPANGALVAPAAIASSTGASTGLVALETETPVAPALAAVPAPDAQPGRRGTSSVAAGEIETDAVATGLIVTDAGVSVASVARVETSAPDSAREQFVGDALRAFSDVEAAFFAAGDELARAPAAPVDDFADLELPSATRRPGFWQRLKQAFGL